MQRIRSRALSACYTPFHVCSGIDVAHVLWSLAANTVQTVESASPAASVQPIDTAVDKLLALLPERIAQLQPADMANVAVAIVRCAAALQHRPTHKGCDARLPYWLLPMLHWQVAAARSACAHSARAKGCRRPSGVRLVQASLRKGPPAASALRRAIAPLVHASHHVASEGPLSATGIGTHPTARCLTILISLVAQCPRNGVPLVGVCEARDRRIVPRARARAVRGDPGRDRQQRVQTVQRSALHIRHVVSRSGGWMHTFALVT